MIFALLFLCGVTTTTATLGQPNAIPAVPVHLNSATTTTTVHHVGNTNTPVVVFDNVLPLRTYDSLRDSLRGRTDFVEGDANNVAFPGKIATVDWPIVGLLLDAVLGNKQLTDIYPRAIFEQREHVRGFASILCNPGWVHNDRMGAVHQDIVAPAAVFYFAFDGVANAPTAGSTTKKTGTAFYREKESGLERLTKLGGNVAAFRAKYPRSCNLGTDDTSTSIGSGSGMSATPQKMAPISLTMKK